MSEQKRGITLINVDEPKYTLADIERAFKAGTKWGRQTHDCMTPEDYVKFILDNKKHV